eukprot:gene31739-25360_t
MSGEDCKKTDSYGRARAAGTAIANRVHGAHPSPHATQASDAVGGHSAFALCVTAPNMMGMSADTCARG